MVRSLAEEQAFRSMEQNRELWNNKKYSQLTFKKNTQNSVEEGILFNKQE